MTSTYSKRWCYVCGKSVSAAGGAWVSHNRKHVREGKMTEHVRRYPKYPYSHVEFLITAETPLILEHRPRPAEQS